MKNKYQKLSLFFMAFTVLALFVSGSAIAEENSNEAATSLTEVEAKNVCMVNDQIFVKDQIPVEVEGNTYYGCCEMCKAKLKNNPESRAAVDPVSGNIVDKAEAVIGAAPNGSVYYFESEENLKNYSLSATN